MPVIINGTTGLSGVSTVNLANGSVTQNILANGVSTTGPAFSAGCNSGNSVSNQTFTKIFFQSEDFDTNNNYDNSNSRFTPTVAGYYMITARQQWVGSLGNNEGFLALYKNGSEYKRGVSSAVNTNISAMVYCNGTTDYLEIYAYQSSGGTLSVNGQSPAYSTFAGFLARAA